MPGDVLTDKEVQDVAAPLTPSGEQPVEEVLATVLSSPESNGGSGQADFGTVNVEASPSPQSTEPEEGPGDGAGASSELQGRAEKGADEASASTVQRKQTLLGKFRSLLASKASTSAPADAAAGQSAAAAPEASTTDASPEPAKPAESECAASGSAEGGHERKDEAKEALSRLLQQKQKALLILKMQAKEKQLAELRSKITTAKASAAPVQKQEKRPATDTPVSAAAQSAPTATPGGASLPAKPVRAVATAAKKGVVRPRSRSREREGLASREEPTHQGVYQLQKDKIEEQRVRLAQVLARKREMGSAPAKERSSVVADPNGSHRAEGVSHDRGRDPYGYSGYSAFRQPPQTAPELGHGVELRPAHSVIDIDSEEEALSAGSRRRGTQVKRSRRRGPQAILTSSSQVVLRSTQSRSRSFSAESFEDSEVHHRRRTEEGLAWRRPVQLQRRAGR